MRLGKTLVAPVITYVPEGSWDPPTGHMGKPGTITLPEDRFIELLVNAGRSLKAGGFKTILFLGESGGNRTGMRTAADAAQRAMEGRRAGLLDRRLLHEVARRSERVHHEDAWASPRIRSAATPTCSTPPRCCSSIPSTCGTKKLAPGGGYENSGVSGDPTKSSAALGKVFLQIKIDNALAQIKGLMAGTIQPVDRRRRRRRGRTAEDAAADAATRRSDAGAGGPPRPPSKPRRRARPRRRRTPSSSTS